MRLLLALLLLASPVLAAKKPKIRFVADPAKAVEMARTRGKLIFLTVVVDNDSENRAVVERVFKDAALQKVLREYICLYANPHDDHGKVRVRLKNGKKVMRCADAITIDCFAHRRCAQQYARGFFDGEVKTPYHLVLDADEEVVARIFNGDPARGYDHVPAGQIVARLQKLLRKHGRGLTQAEYKTITEAQTNLKAARARKNVAAQLRALQTIAAIGKKVPAVEEARARLKEIEVDAGKALQAANRERQAHKWEAALAAYAKVEQDFPGTLAAGRAQKELKSLSKRPEVKKLMKAKAAFEKGLEWVRRGKPELARKKFKEALLHGAGTRYAELAQAEIARLGG